MAAALTPMKSLAAVERKGNLNSGRWAQAMSTRRGLLAAAAGAGLAVAVGLLLLASAGVSGADPSAGSLVSFGYNYFGQLGSATNNKSSVANPMPALVALPGESGTVTQVAAGSDFSLAVTSSGQLYGFGDNQYGQLGNATNNVGGTPNPTPSLVTLPGESGTVTQVAAGTDHSLAVTSSGQLYAFGDNYHGQLGSTTHNGTSSANPTPTLVTLPGGSGTVTQVAAGDDFSLVVTSTGELFSFGANDFGQLGYGANNGTNNANPSPTQVQLPGGSGTVTAVAAGDDFSLVATSSGDLYAFGDNYYGQLGTATNDGVNIANPSPGSVTLPGESGTVTHIAAGSGFSLVVTSSGQLYSFGTNASGQLGVAANDGMSGVPNPTPALVTLPGASGTVTTAAAGEDFSLVVTSSGQLYAFGDGGDGQLGSATSTGPDNATPTLVSLPAASGTAAQVAAGGGQSLVIGASGSGSVTLTIDTTGTGTGSVYGSAGCAKPSSATPTCSESFPYGTAITLDDTTTGSTTFVGWESTPALASCFGPGLCTFTITANTTVTGVFEPPETLTTTVEGDGQGAVETSDYSALLHRGLKCAMASIATPKTCKISYPFGTEETLTAVATAGSRFVGWSGACSGTGTCGVLMDGDQTAIASFSYEVGVHLNAIEITQGIQTTELPTRSGPAGYQVVYKGVPLASEGAASPRETVKLAAGHATVIRVYANTAVPLDGASVPTIRLWEFRNGQRLGPIGPDYTPAAAALPVGPVGQVTAAQRYSTTSVYTFTLPTSWVAGDVYFVADANPDPNEFFDDCGDATCQDAGILLDDIHFNPVTTVKIDPVEFTGTGSTSVKGLKPQLPDPDPAWQTVQEVVPFPLQIAPYQADIELGSTFQGCDGVTQAAGQTTSQFNQAVYIARDKTVLTDLENWITQSGDTSSAIYPYGIVASGIKNTCTGAGGFSGGLTKGGSDLFTTQPASIATDDRPLTAIAHEFHHGIGLPHAGVQCGSGSFGAATASNATTTNGSTQMTLAAANGALAAGQPIIGTGVPAGTVISAVSGTTVTMSQAATSSNANVAYSFGYASFGTTTVNSRQMTSVGLAGALTPGQPIIGPGVPAGTIIDSISGNTITMSGFASSSNNNASYGFGIAGAGQVGSTWPPTFVASTGVPADGLLDGVGLVGLGNPANSPYQIRGPAVAGKSGSEIYDFMSYCTGANDATAWISVRNWNYDVAFHAPGPTVARDSGGHGAAAAAFSAPPPADAGATRSLAITAVYDPLNDRMLSSNVVPSASPPTPTGSGAGYTLTARDSTGRVLAQSGAIANLIHVDPGSTGQPGGSLLLIQGKVPAAGVRQIDVLQFGSQIAQDIASAHTPTAALITPRRGARLGGSRGVVIRWRSHDADGGSLQASLSFSANGGRSWRPVYFGPDTGSATLPAGLLAASRDARLRLFISDGFNEAIVTSPRFVSLGSPPQVVITGPTKPLRLLGGAPLNLSAVAYGDGATVLQGRSLMWRAGHQLLGYGPRITTTALPAGRHRLTVTAREPGGDSSTASVEVTILAAPPTLSVLGAPRRIASKARNLTLRIATLAPAVLTIGRHRAIVDSRPSRIKLSVKPGRGTLTLQLILRSGHYSTSLRLTIVR